MGLDMYLSKKVYVGANYSHNNITGSLALKRDDVLIPINLNKIQYVVEEQAYWRNSNQIHKWFVDNVQEGQDDCGIYEVYGEDLLKLVELCKKVLENHTLADSLLPLEAGLCFGSQEYDEYYFEDLEATIEQLSNIDLDCWYEYSSSW